MTTTVTNIIPAKQAEDAQTGQYSSVGKTIIDKFTATNTSGGAVTLSVNLITSGVAGDGNLIVKEKSLEAKESYAFPEIVGQSLEDGGSISTIASAASSITIMSSGRVIT